MDSRKERQLESVLAARCNRPVKVTQRPNNQICVVFEPSRDRGRVELTVVGAGVGWIVSDRGAVSALYGLDLDLDFVIAKLTAFDTALVRRGDEIISHSNGRSFVESAAEFADSIEFVPVLAGLFANQAVAWPDTTSWSACVTSDRWNRSSNVLAM
jgi:hypothetical protein